MTNLSPITPTSPPVELPLPTTLLTLPPGLRQQIYTTTLLATLPTSHPHPHPFPKHALSLLLVSRLVHAETRLLPFQIWAWAATSRWFGSSVPVCVTLLRRLAPWQLRAVRRLELVLTGADLGDCGRVAELVGLLLLSRRKEEDEEEDDGDRSREGLRELAIKLSSVGPPVPLESFVGRSWDRLDLDRSPWLGDGILRLTSLRRLTITVGEAWTRDSDQERWAVLQEGLRRRMPWIESGKAVVKFSAAKADRGGIEERGYNYWGQWRDRTSFSS